MSLNPDKSARPIGSLMIIAIAVICVAAVIGVTAVAAAIKVERKIGGAQRPFDIRRSPAAGPAPTAETTPKTGPDPVVERLPEPVNDPLVPVPSGPASSPPAAPTPAAPSQPTPTPSAPSPKVPAPAITLERNPIPAPAGFKNALATMFWVGEPASADNGYIHNRASAWDEDWERSFGGFDDPTDRCAYWPCAFKPKENPFYVALPYNDLDDEGERKSNAIRIPWYDPNFPEYRSQLKDRWIETRNGKTVCYGQWEDVGPFEEDDIEYVFGANAAPKNKVDLKAGIDLSPALWDCLQLDNPRSIQWRFVEASAVPKGVWKDIVTGK